MRRLLDFIREDQRGSMTFWTICWLMTFFLFYGLAIDTTHVMHVKARLQTTADAAALGGVIKLRPTESTVNKAAGLDGAKTYAAKNMDSGLYGNFLQDADVRYGYWDFETGGPFQEGISPENAMQVVTRRERASDNPVITSFLRVINFLSWDVNALAVAAVEYEQCELDGLISDGQVIMDSDNTYKDRFCVWGRLGVQLVNGNDFTGDEVHAFVGYSRAVTHECGFFLMGVKDAPPQCNMDSNPGLEQGWFVSDAVFPARLYKTDADGERILDSNGDPIWILDTTNANLVADAQSGTYLTEAQWLGGGPGPQPAADVASQLEAGGKYYLECSQDKNVLEIPNGNYYNLLLATNCLLELSGSSTTNPNIFQNVTFVSTSSASHKAATPYQKLDHNIVIRGGNVLGTDCDGFGTRFFTPSGIKFDGGVVHKGNEVTAGGQVAIDGDNDAASTVVHSVSIHAGGDIMMTSNSQYSLCAPGGLSADARPVYQLVE